MTLYLCDKILKLFFQFFENCGIVCLNKLWLFLSQDVGDAVEGGAQGFVEEQVDVLGVWGRFLSFLLLVNFIGHESNLANILVYLLNHRILNKRWVVIAYLPNKPERALSVYLIIDRPERDEALRVKLLDRNSRTLVDIIHLLQLLVLILEGLENALADPLDLKLVKLFQEISAMQEHVVETLENYLREERVHRFRF